MPQLDLVTFPSQVFWLSLVFLVFYSFVSGHFVPLCHKIIQTRTKKLSVASGKVTSTETSAVRSEAEKVFLKAFDTSINALSVCSQETIMSQNQILRSTNQKQTVSFANSVATIQARYFVSCLASFLTQIFY